MAEELFRKRKVTLKCFSSTCLMAFGNAPRPTQRLVHVLRHFVFDSILLPESRHACVKETVGETVTGNSNRYSLST